jgi:hypothetical protein
VASTLRAATLPNGIGGRLRAVKSSVDGVASGTLPDVVSQTYPQHGQPANGSRRSSIAGHVGGGVGERRGDGLPVGFTRSRKSLSMHYQQEGSPVSELTGKMVHKINGGFPHSSPAAAAHAAEKEKAKTASPPSVSSPMSLLAHVSYPLPCLPPFLVRTVIC